MHLKMYLKVQTDSELLEFIEAIKNLSPEWVAVDTEFFRETTYYPVLGLVQVATKSQVWVIDALACSNLTPLKSLLENPSIKKIFHAGEQDWAIIKQHTGADTCPYYDTQLMATFAKLGHGASLETLVEQFLNIKVDKSQQKTDWLKRPLSEEQLAYAANDAEYVARIYPLLVDRLKDLNRISWVEEDMEILFHKYRQTDFSKDWLKLCTTDCKWPTHFYAFELAKWREDWAKKLNMPRRHILSDAMLEKILQKNSLGHLYIENILPDVHTDLKAFWQNLPKSASAAADKKLHLERMVNEHYSFFSREHRKLLKAWQGCVKSMAHSLGIPPFLLLNKQQLQQLVISNDTKFIKGWRAEYLSKCMECYKNNDG